MSSYRYAMHSRARTVPLEQYTLHHHVAGREVRPCWLNQKECLIVRILPARGEDGKPVSYRYSEEESNFTDWIRSYPCARSFGLQQRRTIILRDPSLETATEEPHPYIVLERTISQAKKHGTLPSEVARVLGMYSNFEPLRPPVRMGYALCLVYAANGEWYCSKDHPPRGWRPDDPLHVLELPTSALVQLELALNAVKDPDAAARGDWNRGFVCGDITDVNGGAFLCFYDPKSRIAIPRELKDIVWNSEEQGRSLDMARYYALVVARKLSVGGVEISPKVSNWKTMASSVPNLGDVIRILSHAEAAEVIAQAFAPCPEFLRFGWHSYRQFFTPRVRQILQSGVVVEDAEGEVSAGPAPKVESRRAPPPSSRRQSNPSAREDSRPSAFLEQVRRQEFFSPDPQFDDPEQEDEAVDDDEEEGEDDTRELEREVDALLERGSPSSDEAELQSGDEDLPLPPSAPRKRERGRRSGVDGLPWQD